MSDPAQHHPAEHLPQEGQPQEYQQQGAAEHSAMPPHPAAEAVVQHQPAPPQYGQPVAQEAMEVGAPPIYDDSQYTAPEGQGAQQAYPGYPQEPPEQWQQQVPHGADPTAAPFDAASTMSPPPEDMTGIRPVPRVSIHAFCETQGVASVVNGASQDRRMAKAHVKVENGGIATAANHYQSTTTPNLIIIETRAQGMEIIGELQALADVCDEGTNVMVIGHQNDVQLYRELTARGVAEYLVAPVTMGEIMNVVNELFTNPEAKPLGNSIAFVGAKGGVGSSTVAHNIAWAISDGFESDVILADFDLAFGTANIDFDKDPPQGVAEAVFSADRMDDTFLDRLLDKCTDHLSLLAAPSTLEREYDFEAEDFRQLIEVAQRSTPNVLIDMPHVWTGWSKNVLLAADKVVITATPDLASLRNTKNLIDLLKEERPNDDKPVLVLNQCNIPKRPEISVEDFSQPLELEPTIILPFEPALFGQASNNGQMIAEMDAKHEVALAFERLAQELTGRREIVEESKSGLGSLLGMFKRKK